MQTEPAAERHVLGALLLTSANGDADCAATVFASLTAADFTDPARRALFAAAQRLAARGEPLEHALWLAALAGELPRADAAAELLECGQRTTSTATVAPYVARVRDASRQRRAVCALTTARNALSAAHDGAAVSAAIAQCRAALDAIAPAEPPADAPSVAPRDPFPVGALPGAVRDYVCAAAAAIGCDPSYIALPLLVCLARAISNRRAVRLKRTWTEPAVIWGAIVGRSGTRKTPAIQAAMQFLARRQAEACAAHAEAQLRNAEDRAVYDRDYADWRRSRKGGPTEPPPWPPAEPHCECVWTSDITVEALADRLSQQQDGVLVARDELASWLGGMDQYHGGRGSDTGHWLATWSAQPMRVERKTGDRKTIYVPRAAVSIIGGVQPGILQRALGREHMQDGLCARLLVVMPEPRAERWTDAIVDPPAEAALEDVFARLWGLEPGADAHGEPAPHALPLSPAAKRLWVARYDQHRAELAELDDDLAAAWAKLEAYTARLALIAQLTDHADADAIGEGAMASGIALSQWFGSEARRVYGVLAESDADRDRRELLELIQRRGGVVTPRDLQRASRRYATAADAEAALAGLVGSGHGRWQVAATATNQRRQFALSAAPTLTHSRGAAETRESVGVGAWPDANGRAAP